MLHEPSYISQGTLGFVLLMKVKIMAASIKDSIVAALLWTQGVIVSWLTSKGMFSLFAAFEGADSQKFNDFLGVEQPLNKFFLT